jgi:hypothetical protein
LPISIYWSGASVPKVEPWDVPPRLVYVPSGNQVRLVDLAARSVAIVLETPEPIESVGIPTLSANSFGHPKQEQPILVRTKQKIYLLDHKHNVVKVFTIPTESDRRSPLDWYEIGDGRRIVEYVRPQAGGEAENVTKRVIYRIADDGTIQDTIELTLQSGAGATSERAQAVLLRVGVPVPAFLLVIEPLFEMLTSPAQGFPAAFMAGLGRSWPWWLPVLALSVVVAVLAWRRSRAFGLSRREQITWTIYVLLPGVPAYVGFVLSRHWPVREPCPNCHAQAARDRAECAECGTRFPEPSLKGTEIFA